VVWYCQVQGHPYAHRCHHNIIPAMRHYNLSIPHINSFTCRPLKGYNPVSDIFQFNRHHNCLNSKQSIHHIGLCRALLFLPMVTTRQFPTPQESFHQITILRLLPLRRWLPPMLFRILPRKIQTVSPPRNR